MEKINLDKYKKKAEEKKNSKTPTSHTAYVVFTVLDKYKVDYSKGWGKKLMGGMLRLQSKGLLEGRIANMEECLQFMKTKEYTKWEKNQYLEIMSTPESIERYLWYKLISGK